MHIHVPFPQWWVCIIECMYIITVASFLGKGVGYRIRGHMLPGCIAFLRSFLILQADSPLYRLLSTVPMYLLHALYPAMSVDVCGVN